MVLRIRTIREDTIGVNASRRYVLWALCVVLALVGTIFLSSCGGGGLFGGGGNLSSSVPVDSDLRTNPGNPRENTPLVLVSEQPGTSLVGSYSTVTLDYSNAAYGYFCVQSYLESRVAVKVYAPDGSLYPPFFLTPSESNITIPFSEGNGQYHVLVYENLYGNDYTGLFSLYIDVQLADEFAPFLYSNQYVYFTDGDDAVRLSQIVTENATSDLEAVEQIYMWVVQSISYDYDKAANVAPGYLPNNSNTLRTEDGICFDFASLAASMMRAQRLPTKLTIGYCGSAYHAWIDVYTTEQGWIRKKIEFPGGTYVRMDPTFDSASKGRGDISKIIGDGTNYSPMFHY